MVEGTSDKVPKNENKGLNWIKEAAKHGNVPALEYKTYWDIRFDRQPKLDKITQNLEKIIKANQSTRALNTLAELNHATASGSLTNQNPELRAAAEEKAAQAAKYYQMSSEQGDVVGTHWMGVFYFEGFGVSKNIAKAIDYLVKASNAGNGQSLYQLFLIHCGKEGMDPKFKNVEAAYGYILRGIKLGVTYFDEATKFFKDNYDLLAPIYVKQKNLPVEIKEETKKDICNMHDAMVNELRIGFSSALSKDRLYHRPCGFLNDQQIWMLGV